MDWDDAAVRRLREDWAAGYSGAEIGRRLGTSKSAVVGKANRLKLDARPSPINRGLDKISGEQIAAIRAGIKNGESDYRIARDLGLNDGTVQRRRLIDGLGKRPINIVRTLPQLARDVVTVAPAPRPVVARPAIVRQPPRPAPEPPRIDASRVCQFMSGHRHHWVPCGKPAIGSWCPEHRRKVFVQRRDRGEEAA